MNFIHDLLLLFHLFISLVHYSDPAEPLIFNPNTYEIYTNSLDSNFEGPFAEACPLDTENKTENEINENSTRDGKGLIVRNFHYLPTEQAKPNTQCKEGFQLAAVFRTEGTWDVIEFGYEVYFRYDTLPIHLHNDFDEKYAPVSYAGSFWHRLFHKNKHDDSDDDDDSKNDNALQFMWIKKISIRYDVDLWNFIEMGYTIHRNVARQLKVKCNDYNLGIKIYDQQHRNFDKFYSADNQKKIFANVQLPEGNACESTHECVKKYDILMPHHFEPYQNAPVSCSNLTTIPIWHQRIEELLNNLEIFLTAMGQLIPNELTIIPGVHDVLSFPKKWSFRSKLQPMYLHEGKKRIPIPRIIYKLLKYQSFHCNAEKASCWFNVVVVIHNEPEVPKEEKLCPVDMSQEWGLERIKLTNASTSEGDSSEYIYCCEWNEQLRAVLGYQSSEDIGDNLNLYYFPIYDPKKRDTFYVNKKDEIYERMKQLQKEVET